MAGRVGGAKVWKAGCRCVCGQQVDLGQGGWRESMCLENIMDHLGEVSGGQNAQAWARELSCDP